VIDYIHIESNSPQSHQETWVLAKILNKFIVDKGHDLTDIYFNLKFDFCYHDVPLFHLIKSAPSLIIAPAD
jgi:hypothetical protein